MHHHKQSKKKYHKNGFSPPLSIQQWQSWSLILLEFLGFYLFVVPFLDPETIQTAFLVTYVVVTVLGFVAYFLASLTDPVHSDVALSKVNCEKERQAALKGEFQSFDRPGPKDGRECASCDITRDTATKHCSVCRKCIRSSITIVSFSIRASAGGITDRFSLSFC
eukprot:991414_1